LQIIVRLRPEVTTRGCNWVATLGCSLPAEIIRPNDSRESPGITEILLEESRIVHKWGRDELRGMVVEFNRQLSALKMRFKESS